MATEPEPLRLLACRQLTPVDHLSTTRSVLVVAPEPVEESQGISVYLLKEEGDDYDDVIRLAPNTNCGWAEWKHNNVAYYRCKVSVPPIPRKYQAAHLAVSSRRGAVIVSRDYPIRRRHGDA